MSQKERRTWTLADFERPGGVLIHKEEYIAPDGCSYDGPADAIATGIFAFCGCGMPGAALDYVLAGLDLVAALKDSWDAPSPDDAYQAWCARRDEHFGSDGAGYFFWYWCDNEGLIEHGGSVPGWLTERGEKIRADIRRVRVPPHEQQTTGAE